MGLINKKTVKDVNLAGKRVLLRADYNVPVKAGRITDDYRLRQSVPTINYILDQKPAALIIISHLGRPEGKPDSAFSLIHVAKRLGELIDRHVAFAGDCVGQTVVAARDQLTAGGVLLLENLRFYAGEEANDADFAKQIVQATGAEVFVQDGFGVVHRAHASTDAITKLVPSVAGLLLDKELTTITSAMEMPKRPFTAVIGGAKISDKIDVINKFIEIADCVAVVGALANDFISAQKIPIGKSVVDSASLGTARDVLEAAKKAEASRDFNFLVPVDAVVSTSLDGTKPTRLVDLASQSQADIMAYPKTPQHSLYTVGAEEMILDIGPISAGTIAGAVKLSKTVVWAGTAGVTETKGIAGAHDPFAHGTHTIVQAMIGNSRTHKNRPYTIVGGGDTVAYVESEDLLEDFDHVSTGGSASLELMAGHKLPGVESLEDK